MAKTPDTLLVRLKPFNPRRGYVMKTYVDGQTGAVFKEDRGWYEVDAAYGERLREVRSEPLNEESPPAFDVCTKAEAIELERRQKQAAAERATALDPRSVEGASRDHLGGRVPRQRDAKTNAITTADLPENQPPLRGPLLDEPADESDLDSEDLAADVAASAPVPGTPDAPASNPPKTKPRNRTNKPPTVPGAPDA
jgi:hypothetical protein